MASPAARPRPRAAGPSIASAPIITSAGVTSRSIWATPRSTPMRSSSSPIRTGRPPPATSSSHRPTAASPPIAPTSTSRRSSARSTTPGAWRRSVHRRRGRHRRQDPRRRWPAGSSARSPPTPGIASQALTADTDVYFFGETIEKTGPKKYKITNGGFTTCVQPTPRWELHSSTVVLNLDQYTVLRNAVFRVKGVPLLYTPFLYYPTKRDDRATGFLLPTYGATSLRGQSIHNAFFWAIDRSQDATALYDWYSNDGAGGRQRIPLQLRPRLERKLQDLLARPEGHDRRVRGDGSTPAAATSCAAPPTRDCRAGFAPGRTSTTSPASRRCRR